MSKFERIAISKKLRFDVFKRDSFTCQYCGASPPAVLLECDHISPVALGGATDAENLVTACQACNRGKGASPLDDVPKPLAELAAETAEREAQIAGYEAVMRERRERLDADAYEVLEKFCTHFDGKSGIPKKDFLSIRRFVEQLGLDKVIEANEIAIAKKSWSYSGCFRYFCGVCWGMIKDRDGIPR